MSRRVVLAVVLAFILVPAVLAKDPPIIPGPPPPPWQPGTPEDDVTPAVFDGPRLPDHISPVMSTARLPIETAPRRGPRATTSASSSSTIRRGPSVTPFDVPSWLNVLYSGAVASNETDIDAETAIYARTGATTSTVTTFMHLDRSQAVPHYLTRFATSTDLTSNAATFTRGSLYLPTGYQETVDPTLAGNPYADGQRPGAIYATGLLGNRPSSTASLGNPMSIRVWASDDGGTIWTTGQTVASTTSSSVYTLDKPVSDVSWWPGTRGYLYVAWVEFENDGSNRIRLRRNWGGLWTRCRPYGGICDTSWDPSITVRQGAAGESPHAPQVVVNHNNGHVYVFWMTAPGATGQLMLSRSTDNGVNWSAPITVVSSIRITGNGGYLNNGLRAVVVPTIRFNTATGLVSAVWHATTAAGATNQAAIYFATFNASTISGALPAPAAIVDDTGAEIQPALDNDGSGNLLVTYYDTTGEEQLYRLNGICVNSSGVRSCGPTTVSGNHPTRTGSGLRIFIGDYHDVFYFTYPDALGGRWNSSWSASSGDHDILVTGIR